MRGASCVPEFGPWTPAEDGIVCRERRNLSDNGELLERLCTLIPNRAPPAIGERIQLLCPRGPSPEVNNAHVEEYTVEVDDSVGDGSIEDDSVGFECDDVALDEEVPRRRGARPGRRNLGVDERGLNRRGGARTGRPRPSGPDPVGAIADEHPSDTDALPATEPVSVAPLLVECDDTDWAAHLRTALVTRGRPYDCSGGMWTDGGSGFGSLPLSADGKLGTVPRMAVAVALNDRVRWIDCSVFRECTGLQRLSIYSGIESIDFGAARSLPGFDELHIVLSERTTSKTCFVAADFIRHCFGRNEDIRVHGEAAVMIELRSAQIVRAGAHPAFARLSLVADSSVDDVTGSIVEVTRSVVDGVLLRSRVDAEDIIRHATFIQPQDEEAVGPDDADEPPLRRERRAADLPLQMSHNPVWLAVANDDPGLIAVAQAPPFGMRKILAGAALLPTPDVMIAIVEKWPEWLDAAFDAEALHGKHPDFFGMFRDAVVPITSYVLALRNRDPAVIRAVRARVPDGPELAVVAVTFYDGDSELEFCAPDVGLLLKCDAFRCVEELKIGVEHLDTAIQHDAVGVITSWLRRRLIPQQEVLKRGAIAGRRRVITLALGADADPDLFDGGGAEATPMMVLLAQKGVVYKDAASAAEAAVRRVGADARRLTGGSSELRATLAHGMQTRMGNYAMKGQLVFCDQAKTQGVEGIVWVPQRGNARHLLYDKPANKTDIQDAMIGFMIVAAAGGGVVVDGRFRWTTEFIQIASSLGFELIVLPGDTNEGNLVAEAVLQLVQEQVKAMDSPTLADVANMWHSILGRSFARFFDGVLDIPAAHALCGGMSAISLAGEPGAFAGLIEATPRPARRLEPVTENKCRVLPALGLTQAATGEWTGLDPLTVRGVVAQHASVPGVLTIASDLAESKVLSVGPVPGGSFAVWFAEPFSRMIEFISTDQVWAFPPLANAMVVHLTRFVDGRIVGVCGDCAVVAVGPVYVEISLMILDAVGVSVTSAIELAPNSKRRVVRLNSPNSSDAGVDVPVEWLQRLVEGPAIPFTKPTVATIRALAPRLKFRKDREGVTCVGSTEYEEVVLDDPSGSVFAVFGGSVSAFRRENAIAIGDLFLLNVPGAPVWKRDAAAMGQACAVALRSFVRQVSSTTLPLAMQKVVIGLLALGLLRQPYPGDGALARQVGVSRKTASKYVTEALVLGIPPVPGVSLRQCSRGAASRSAHVQRLLDEGRFAGWPAVAGRLDRFAGGRVRFRASRFADAADRDAFVEVTQAVVTLRLLDSGAGWREVVQEMVRAGNRMLPANIPERIRVALDFFDSR